MTVKINTRNPQPDNHTDLNNFIDTANDKYKKLKNIILKQHRRTARQTVSIKNVSHNNDDQATIIGMVKDKHRTKKGDKFLLTVEDPTDTIKVLVSEKEGEQIVEDEVLLFRGNTGRNIIFSNQVIRPGLPLRDKDELPKTNEPKTAVFISDLHYGSTDFIDQAATNFITWMHKKQPDYLLIAGDAVEGIGIYPDQKKELQKTDIYEQFQLFQDFILSMPDDTHIVISPGNHDPVRLAEPQPPIPRKYMPKVYDRDKTYVVPNPCRVQLADKINVLMYHGMSFDDHVSTVKKLRDNAYKNPEIAMVDWLKRRHLSPTYGNSPAAPIKEDRLTIRNVPDVLHMGHTHSFAAATYKGVNMICSSTFQGQTDFQKRVGHKPDPGKVAHMDLSTREVNVENIL